MVSQAKLIELIADLSELQIEPALKPAWSVNLEACDICSYCGAFAAHWLKIVHDQDCPIPIAAAVLAESAEHDQHQ